MHLHAKFKVSAILFPSEWDKIDYIRDHCKSIVFKVIKARADPDSDNPYNIADKTIKDLDSMFGVYDPITKAESKLHNSDFGMGGKNPKETFDEFLARFSLVVAPLGFTDLYKISNMRRLLSDRLKQKLADGTTYKTFRQYVTRYRQCDLDMRQINRMTNKREKTNTNTRGGRTTQQNSYQSNYHGKSSTSNISNDSGSNTANLLRNNKTRRWTFPPHLQDRLKKQRRCFKCLKPGHMSMDVDAPYKTAPFLTKKQISVELKTIKVEINLNNLSKN